MCFLEFPASEGVCSRIRNRRPVPCATLPCAGCVRIWCNRRDIFRNRRRPDRLVGQSNWPRSPTMSDPGYRDPRLDPPPLREDEARARRLGELESSNAMWGWVAGAVVLALVLVFVFTRSPSD